MVFFPTMAFIVPTRKGTFEIRESRSTPAGPRSRTLATFKELTEETIEKAQVRAVKPPSADELREAALRGGAPVAPAPADRAAPDLLGRLAKGQSPNPMLKRRFSTRSPTKFAATGPRTLRRPSRTAPIGQRMGRRQRPGARRGA